MHRITTHAAFGVLLLLMVTYAWADNTSVRTVEFSAASVGRKMKYNIVLPTGYEQSGKRFPVLYLLHGSNSDYTAWARMKAPEHARNLPLIVVMPDAGYSWYVNWSRSDDDQKNQWEDYIVKDLIGHVDAPHRTIAAREGRAIIGFSMGGYGSINLGLKHPDMFCSIGSHSGALGFAKAARRRIENGEPPMRRLERSTDFVPGIGIEGFSSPAERSPKGTIFLTVEDCQQHDRFALVLTVPRETMPHIYLDCGVDDRLNDAAKDFIQLLIEHKIPFTYAQSEGGHQVTYWERELSQSMAVQYLIIERKLAGLEANYQSERGN